VVLGVGGGKTIDVAKLSSTREHIPFISAPTTASHDGIASPRASIKDLPTPTSVEAQSPIAIIADTNVISKAPHRLIASGCGDLIAKYTAVHDWTLGHKRTGEYYGDYAAALSNLSATLVTRNAELIRSRTEEGFRVVLEALLSCGVAMSIAGSSRPCSGSEHAFSHALDQVAPRPALHGEQCGVGSIVMSCLQGLDWKMIKRTLTIVGAPTTARELGIEPQYIIKALVQAGEIYPERYTILNEKVLAETSARELARTTGILE
jgi:glycerol-1-phosphate dehydrogenase [NAD(P)+]